MKKLTLAISIALLSGFSAISQIPKGTKYIGGAVGFNTSKQEQDSSVNSKSSTWNFNPEVGYFFADNLSGGLVLNIGGGKTENKQLSFGAKSDETKKSSFGFGLYARKFYNISDNFSLFAGLTFMNGSSKNERTQTFSVGADRVTENTTKTSSLYLSGGLAYSLSKRFTMVGTWAPGLGFETIKEKTKVTQGSVSSTTPEYKTTNAGFDINTFGNPFTVGLYYSF